MTVGLGAQGAFWEDGLWRRVSARDARARALADRHYSRQTPGASDFMASGRKLVLLTLDERAVWGAIENLDPVGNLRWRVSLFRNEGPTLSSALVIEATTRTYLFWTRHYRSVPAVPLQTEVDPRSVRSKRDPGRCFLRAGWRTVGVRRGLVVLEAPPQGARSHAGPKRTQEPS